MTKKKSNDRWVYRSATFETSLSPQEVTDLLRDSFPAERKKSLPHHHDKLASLQAHFDDTDTELSGSDDDVITYRLDHHTSYSSREIVSGSIWRDGGRGVTLIRGDVSVDTPGLRRYLAVTFSIQFIVAMAVFPLAVMQANIISAVFFGFMAAVLFASVILFILLISVLYDFSKGKHALQHIERRLQKHPPKRNLNHLADRPDTANTYSQAIHSIHQPDDRQQTS